MRFGTGPSATTPIRRGVALVAVSGAAVIALAIGATAAPTGLTSTLGAGTARVGDCGNLSLVRPSYDLVSGAVTSVTLDGLPASCVGARLRIALVSASGAALATGGPVTSTGSTVVVTTLSAAPAAADVVTVHVSAVGR